MRWFFNSTGAAIRHEVSKIQPPAYPSPPAIVQ